MKEPTGSEDGGSFTQAGAIGICEPPTQVLGIKSGPPQRHETLLAAESSFQPPLLYFLIIPTKPTGSPRGKKNLLWRE